MADIKPYQISVPEESLQKLKAQLALTSFPDELEDSEWDYGVPLADIKRLVKYWQEEYDWRHHEAEINKLPQYITPISVKGFDDLDIHFLHQPSPKKTAIPLLFVHGWPGSFLEVTKILPLLANPKEGEPAFHIVAPSIPNFGFSQGVKKKGFGIPQYAETCHNLMQKLGYTQYVTQGGDWGYWITRTIAHLYPTACKATHINMMDISPPPSTSSLTPLERTGLDRTNWFTTQGMGYSSLQSTKPQTLAYSLASSPCGLLAWIHEKLHDWTDAYPWTDDEILTWVSIYAFSTAGPAASVRIYYEAIHRDGGADGVLEAVRGYIGGVKLGLAFFPRDIFVYPPGWCRGLGDVVFEHLNESGGHFGAWERPESVAGDLKEMFEREKGGAFGCVEGRDGY
ncbi:MAG: hypothetical protein LQ350_004696 [Teloschistes chrysophthalmus]|nr:MAG: hypothetical protein LQ350_004696 [Niorma chrysophthalma]